MFRKIELWVVLLLALLGIIAAILFAGAARHYAMGGRALGAAGPAVDAIASTPTTLKRLATGPAGDVRTTEQRFAGQSGFRFNTAWNEDTAAYLLLNRYDGDQQMGVTELIDLGARETVHQYRFDVDPLWRVSTIESAIFNISVDRKTARFRGIHSYLRADGDVITKDHGSPLIRVDPCGQGQIWLDDDLYHHSIEADGNGMLWIPKHIEPSTAGIGDRRFRDDGIAQISPAGEVKFQRSLAKMLDANGLGWLVYDIGNDTINDPLHLNDIQPVLSDSPHWQRGDVFISLRNKSLILLYRPVSDQVIWHQSGPWISQHDVDILDDNRIAVFSNNLRRSGSEQPEVQPSNQVMIYNFSTHKTQVIAADVFSQLELRTPTEGLAEILPSGGMVVEETDFGRIIAFDAAGSVQWQYVNRAGDGQIYQLGWSRLISRLQGDKLRIKIKEKRCVAN